MNACLAWLAAPGAHRKFRREVDLGGFEMTTAARSPQPELRSAPGRPAKEGLDLEKIRRDFPILQEKIHGKPLVYLDNAATSQKPRAVLDAMIRYYERGNANIHRGVHFLSEHATEEHEAACATVQRFGNAAHDLWIICVRG